MCILKGAENWGWNLPKGDLWKTMGEPSQQNKSKRAERSCRELIADLPRPNHHKITHIHTDASTLTPKKLLKYSAALSTSKKPCLEKLQIPRNNNMLQKRPAGEARDWWWVMDSLIFLDIIVKSLYVSRSLFRTCFFCIKMYIKANPE